MGSRPTAEQPLNSAFDAMLVRNKISQYVQNLQESSAHQHPMPAARVACYATYVDSRADQVGVWAIHSAEDSLWRFLRC